MGRYKRLDGKDEPIIEPEIEIVDSHHHLWMHPTMPYMLEDYLSDAAAGHNIVASVYVETQAFLRPEGPERLRPLGEIEFANGMAAMAANGAYGPCRACSAIVGHADLREGGAIGEFLDWAIRIAPERFRGVRQVTNEHPDEALYRYFKHRPPRGIMEHPNFIAGLKELEKRRLSFDASVFHHQLPALAKLADAVPDLPIIVNHMGLAVALDMDAAGRTAIFEDWRRRLREIAERPNVSCKIGGLGLPYWGFGLEERDEATGFEALAALWRPYVRAAIDAFGPDRCMMESNFSADARSCGFVPLWNALKWSVRDMSAAEKVALFSGTAKHVYRI
ncbi:amidohydrolase [Caballeronia calidae]|uniref:Amidohydrolase n=1 Tax=Caballeronia calidae TaxID=1777139 RepID=A0A158DV89_9BURK|nr:amidohydrolase family protein [Caballeronia calidae]SAK98474.1 amidohydrolase [Caballeronia calidae]